MSTLNFHEHEFANDRLNNSLYIFGNLCSVRGENDTFNRLQ